MDTDPKALVARSYDRIAARHAAWAERTRAEERERYTALLLECVPPGAAVLELGCGAGVPTTRRLAGRCAVTAVDISAGQLELARRNVPGARFLHADMAALDFPPATFDAVAAFYSLIHVPRDEHPALLASIARWLRPGGWFVASLGARSNAAGYEDDWLGAPMYWSHFDAATNRRLIEAVGLRIVLAREETADEDGVPATFLWVVAQAS